MSSIYENEVPEKFFLFIQQEDERFNAWFPRCPGCATFGTNPIHAFEMAKEALGGWLDTQGWVDKTNEIVFLLDEENANPVQITWVFAKDVISQ